MNELCKGDLSNMNGKVPFDAAEQNDAAGIKVVNDYHKLCEYLPSGHSIVIRGCMQSKREAYGAIDGIYKDPVLWKREGICA